MLGSPPQQRMGDEEEEKRVVLNRASVEDEFLRHPHSGAHASHGGEGQMKWCLYPQSADGQDADLRTKPAPEKGFRTLFTVSMSIG
eukprot:5090817-Amphidinium_carterae.2